MGIGSQQYPKPGEREEQVAGILNDIEDVRDELKQIEANEIVKGAIHNAMVKNYDAHISDQRKVMEALWMITKLAEKQIDEFEFYMTPTQRCESGDEDYASCDAWEKSQTLEQFTNKILEAKD